MNGHLYFETQADDPHRAMAFYGKVFGWRFEKIGGLPVQYWRIETGGARGGLLRRPAQPPPPHCGTNAFVCSVEVDDYDATGAQITESGGRVALEKFAVPSTCWQGYFLDTEGNTFGIFQVDQAAA
jgi:predicted enzyme related to lactoylglutathione lyase